MASRYPMSKNSGYTQNNRLTSTTHYTNTSATYQVLLLPWLRLFDLFLFSLRRPWYHTRPSVHESSSTDVPTYVRTDMHYVMHVRKRAGAKSSLVAQFSNAR